MPERCVLWALNFLSLLAAECKQTAQEIILKSCNLTKNVNNKVKKCRKCQKCQISNVYSKSKSNPLHQFKKVGLDRRVIQCSAVLTNYRKLEKLI